MSQGKYICTLEKDWRDGGVVKSKAALLGSIPSTTGIASAIERNPDSKQHKNLPL